MSKISYLLFILAIGACTIGACKKWKDPAPTTDPRLTNPYCNDPNAVNYNWGFPGKPDNSICFYPTDLFKGYYKFIDSVHLTSSNIFIRADSGYLNIAALSQYKIAVIGFCGGDSLKLTAVGYTASIDSLLGDTTTTARGQRLCRLQDTASGTITDNRIDSLLHITFQVISDTGRTTHYATAKKM